MVADKKEFLKILESYSSKEDMERFRDIVNSKDKKEFLGKVAMKRRLSEVRQCLSADIILHNDSAASEMYPVCTAIISNSGDKPEEVTVRVSVGTGIVSDTVYTVPAGMKDSRKVRVIGFDKEMHSLQGGIAACEVSISDSYGREISSAIGDVGVFAESVDTDVTADISCAPLSDLQPGSVLSTVTLRNNSDDPVSCTVLCRLGGRVYFIRNVAVPANGECSESVYAPVVLDGFEPESLVVSVLHNGQEIVPSSSMGKSAGGGASILSKKEIFAECVMQKMIDTYLQENGYVDIGSLVISNKEPRPETCFITVDMGPENLMTQKYSLQPNSMYECVLKVPVSILQREESYQSDIRCMLQDSEGNTIFSRTLSVNVRSKYDLDLKKLNTRTAEFVNPLLSEIASFVDSKDGALARAMGSRFSITGYQSESNIAPQLEAVWKAVQSMNMSYVSDVSTVRKSGDLYQKVRTPDKVISDRTGNCIELSIMFASIFEAMGFEPVVVFPRGHAIVGVVMGTDAYRSQSIRSSKFANSLVRLNVKGKGDADVLFLESTCCPHRGCTLEDAIDYAYKHVTDQISSINGRQMFCIIPIARSSGIKPGVF